MSFKDALKKAWQKDDWSGVEQVGSRIGERFVKAKKTTEERTEELKEKRRGLVEKRKISEALKKAKRDYRSEKYHVSPTTRAKDVAISRVARKTIKFVTPKTEGYSATQLKAQRKHQLALMKAQQQHQLKMAQQEQISMQQDPRFQDQRDQFLEEHDYQLEQQIAMANQQIDSDPLLKNMPPKSRQNYISEYLKQFGRGLQNIGSSVGKTRILSHSQRVYRPQAYDSMGVKTNILNASKNTGISLIRPQYQPPKQKLSLMGSEQTKRRDRLRFTSAERLRLFGGRR